MVFDAEHHLSIHLDETTIAVIGEAFIAALVRQPLYHAVVEPEVEYRVHHARHRNTRTGAYRDEKRVFGISEAGTEGTLDPGERAFDLFAQFRRIRFVVRIKMAAGFSGNCEAGRHRQRQIPHRGKAGALAPEQISQIGASLGGAIAKPVNPSLHLALTL